MLGANSFCIVEEVGFSYLIKRISYNLYFTPQSIPKCQNIKRKSKLEKRLDKYEHACAYLQDNVLIIKVHKALTSVQHSAGCKNGKEVTNDVAPRN